MMIEAWRVIFLNHFNVILIWFVCHENLKLMKGVCFISLMTSPVIHSWFRRNHVLHTVVFFFFFGESVESSFYICCGSLSFCFSLSFPPSLSALGQIMLYVDGMNGVTGHAETIQWLYALVGSKVCSFMSMCKLCKLPIYCFVDIISLFSYPVLSLFWCFL